MSQREEQGTQNQTTTLRAREDAAALALKARGVTVSRPMEGNPKSDVYDCWGVCVGSHGGYAKTLRGAMQRCLNCCGIGSWWAVAPPDDNELLLSLFRTVAERHRLGRLSCPVRKVA